MTQNNYINCLPHLEEVTEIRNMTVMNGESKGHSEMALPKASTALGNTGPPLCKESLCVIHLPNCLPNPKPVAKATTDRTTITRYNPRPQSQVTS